MLILTLNATEIMESHLLLRISVRIIWQNTKSQMLLVFKSAHCYVLTRLKKNGQKIEMNLQDVVNGAVITNAIGLLTMLMISIWDMIVWDQIVTQKELELCYALQV